MNQFSPIALSYANGISLAQVDHRTRLGGEATGDIAIQHRTPAAHLSYDTMLPRTAGYRGQERGPLLGEALGLLSDVASRVLFFSTLLGDERTLSSLEQDQLLGG